MYLYGGVTYNRTTGQRRAADAKAGTVYAYRFATGAWEKLETQGGGRAAAAGPHGMCGQGTCSSACSACPTRVEWGDLGREA